MHEITLALAILICTGFFMAKLGQMMRLPSVTGYICAGLLLGPSFLNLIHIEIIGSRLNHFTQIALMLIAFGIGEQLEIKRLRKIIKSVSLIGLFETSGAFFLVAAGTFIVARLTNAGEAGWLLKDYLILSVLLGTISVATAPAATLLVMRELKASGPMTSTLMAVVAVNNSLAIMFFGIAVSAVRFITGTSGITISGAITGSLYQIISALLMGIATGLLIDLLVHKLKNSGEMLTAGLMLLLICGEGARFLHLSPLLAGMAAGITIVNRDRRDVRVFRAINSFEPPIYVLFFTLAGASLHVSALAATGWIGLVYFLLRISGKIGGSRLGAILAKAPVQVQRYLGLALVPQAGVAIGLVYLIQGDASIAAFSSIITPAVLAAVVMSELAGPLCARISIEKAGESGILNPPSSDRNRTVKGNINEIRLSPWTWKPLIPSQAVNGTVIFGASNIVTIKGLARIATLIASYHNACPLAVHVITHERMDYEPGHILLTQKLLELAESETNEMGYMMDIEIVHAQEIAAGLIESARKNNASGIVLGHPVKGTAQEFQLVVEAVAGQAPCPVIVTRFNGILHTERIMVPFTDKRELDILQGVVRALSEIDDHRIILLMLISPESSDKDIAEAENDIRQWISQSELALSTRCRVVAAESRLETILHEAEGQDLILMAASPSGRLQRIFFGSLCEDVALQCNKPMLMVQPPVNRVHNSKATGPQCFS